jgi:adenine-specific DNA-methyltransferase
VRYLGNKTRLIPFLMNTVDRLGIEPGVACDPFAGTASVGCALKQRGWRVHSGDLLALSYAFQVARVELDRTPRFAGLRTNGTGTGPRVSSYRAVLSRLRSLPPRHGFISEHYAPDGESASKHGRMYFTPENAHAIDTVRETIADWTADGRLDRTSEQLLLASLIQGADRVANTTGVYASFVKSWQPNALKSLELRPLRPVPGVRGSSGCTSFRGPAVDRVRDVGGVDLVYLDPPYNQRQYPGYYHIPELLATGWNPPPELRGKTGLIPDDEIRSDWCRSSRCEPALRELLAASDARHVLLSYNDEGLLTPEVIEDAFREVGLPDSYRRFRRGYRRYRSDADGPGRNYSGDRVGEWVHYVRRR